MMQEEGRVTGQVILENKLSVWRGHNYFTRPLPKNMQYRFRRALSSLLTDLRCNILPSEWPAHAENCQLPCERDCVITKQWPDITGFLLEMCLEREMIRSDKIKSCSPTRKYKRLR